MANKNQTETTSEDRLNDLLLSARNLIICKQCGTPPKLFDACDKNAMMHETEWVLYCPNEHAHAAISKWNEKNK